MPASRKPASKGSDARTDPKATARRKSASAADRRLAAARAEIDRIDDAIHDLLMQRAVVVADVAAAKGPGIAAQTPVRIAREAQMLRRLAARHEGSLPFTAVADLWHELIAASTAIQAPFTVVVAGSGSDAIGAYNLARQQFGSAIPISVVDDARSALRQVADGSAGVAVLPPPESGGAGGRAGAAPWWTLLTPLEDGPRIVCALPSVIGAGPDEPVRRRYLSGDGERPVARAVAVARAPFDPSGDDVTLMIGTSPGFVSPATCAGAFDKAEVSAWRLAAADDPHGGPERDKGAGTAQLHLIAFDGYVAADDPRLTLLLAPAGGPFGDVFPVGGYPVPVSA